MDAGSNPASRHCQPFVTDDSQTRHPRGVAVKGARMSTATAEPAARRSTGVRVVNETGRRVVEVTCYDERRGAALVVLTDGEHQWAEGENVSDLRAYDGVDIVEAEPIVRAMCITHIDECGKYHRFPKVRR